MGAKPRHSKKSRRRFFYCFSESMISRECILSLFFQLYFCIPFMLLALILSLIPFFFFITIINNISIITYYYYYYYYYYYLSSGVLGIKQIKLTTLPRSDFLPRGNSDSGPRSWLLSLPPPHYGSPPCIFYRESSSALFFPRRLLLNCAFLSACDTTDQVLFTRHFREGLRTVFRTHHGPKNHVLPGALTHRTRF